MFLTNRINKIKAAGMALYVDATLKCKAAQSMSTAADDIMACINIKSYAEISINIFIN